MGDNNKSLIVRVLLIMINADNKWRKKIQFTWSHFLFYVLKIKLHWHVTGSRGSPCFSVDHFAALTSPSSRLKDTSAGCTVYNYVVSPW